MQRTGAWASAPKPIEPAQPAQRNGRRPPAPPLRKLAAAIAVVVLTLVSSGRAEAQVAAVEPNEPPARSERKAASKPKTPEPLSPVFGLGVTMTSSGSPRSVGVTAQFVSHETEGFRDSKLWQQHTIRNFSIGGGGNGFEGSLMSHGAIGVALFEDGLVLAPRIGTKLEYFGNNHFTHGLVGIPMLEVGFGYQGDGYRLEVGPYAGLALVQLARVDGHKAETDRLGFFVGDYAQVAFRGFHFSVDALRRQPTQSDGSRPVHRFDARMCVAAETATLCIQGRMLQGEGREEADSRRLVAYQAGILFGFRVGE